MSKIEKKMEKLEEKVEPEEEEPEREDLEAMSVPELRELAKEEYGLTGISKMRKDELIEAIQEAESEEVDYI